MKFKYATLMATTAILAGGNALAQDGPVDLGTLILSGGLTPINAADLQRSFTVVTSETIEDKGFDSVLDVLRNVPGFQPSVGGLNSFRIRGAESNHALVLVDGIEVQLGSSGDFELGNIPVSDIESIEVLRGPQSASFGANAAAGVINIVTKGGAGVPGTSGEANIEFGNGGIRNLGFNLRHQGERGFIALNFAKRDIADFDVSNDVGGKDDAFEATALGFKGEYNLTDNLVVGVILRSLDRAEDYDDNAFPFGVGDAKKDYVVDADNTRLDDEVSGAIYLRGQSANGQIVGDLRYSELDADRVFDSAAFGASAQNTGREQWRGTLTYGIDGAVTEADHLATLRLEHETESFRNSGFSGDRDVASLALEYRGQFANGLDLQIGVRRDDNEAFEDATTWNAAIGYQVSPTTTLRASAGKGIINPTFFEQFGFSGTFAGNPDLDPEQLTGWDVGVDHIFMDGRGRVSLTYFDQEITNNISSETVGGVTRPVNLTGTSDQSGIELSADFALTDTLTFDLAYTYTDATDPGGNRSRSVAENQLNLGVRLETFGGNGDVWAQLNHVAGIEDFDRRDFSQVELDSFTIVNVGASYRFSDTVEIYGRIENLTEETYEEQWGYERSDRVIAVGLRSTF